MGAPHADIERLYEELGPVLLAYARSIVQDLAEAEDVLQHVFLKLMASGGALPIEPRPYLFRAVRNTSLNRKRGEARERAWQSEPPMFAAPAALGWARHGPRSRVAVELPEEQREAVVLRVWGEIDARRGSRGPGRAPQHRRVPLPVRRRQAPAALQYAPEVLRCPTIPSSRRS